MFAFYNKMKCKHTYLDQDKTCPHRAQKGKELCIWHEEIDQKDMKGIDAHGQDLDDAYLVGANLDGANLEKCSMIHAKLSGANIEEAKLAGIIAKEADFSKTQMRKVDLSGSFLKYSNFEGSIMANSDLHNSDLSWVNFNKAIMTGANMQKSSLLDANLENTILLNATLFRSIMRGAELNGADLQIADLREVDLRGANLKGSNIRGSNLKDANLKYSNLEGAILSNSNLQDADFARAQLKNVYMQGSSMQRANLRECDIENANLSDANLENAILRGANMKGANINNANLHNADIFNVKVEGIKNLRYAKIDDLIIPERRADDHRAAREHEEAIKLYDEAMATYIDLKNYFSGEGLYGRSGDFYIREWSVKGKLQRTASDLPAEKLKGIRFLRYYLPFSFNRKNSRFFSLFAKFECWTNWVLNKVLYTVAKYGESPLRVLGTSLSIIMIYSIIYWIVGGITTGGSGFKASFPESFYFSAVTFTTLGYGDYQPIPDFQILAISEAFIGAFVLAFFVVVVSRKLIR